MSRPKRYPLEPFFAIAGWNMNRVHQVDPCNGPEYRLRKDRGVTFLIADRVATAAGYNPAEIWPDWLNDSIEVEAQTCAAADCDRRFVPTNRRQKYCGDRCRQRAWKRRNLETPEGRARNRASAARYFAENGDYVRARQRRYYHTNAERERARARANRERRRAETVKTTPTKGAA